MFSKDSRWDRQLPHQSYEEEPIEVGAVFKKGQLIPKWFIWQGRHYPVKTITYEWQDQRGDQTLRYFSVSDGVNLYQIYLNNKYLNWRLVRVSAL